MKISDISRLIHIVSDLHIDGYDYDYANERAKPCLKEEFIKLSKAYLRMISKELGLSKGEFEIRVNRGGAAVSGEITLHSDTLYVQFSQSCLGTDFGFMYRSCKGRKDYTGGTNRWMKWDKLTDIAFVKEEFKKAMIGH